MDLETEMAVLPRRGGVMTGPFSQTTIRLPTELLEGVERVALDRGYSRNVAIYELIRAGLAVLEQEIASEAEMRRAAEERETLQKQVDLLLAEVRELKAAKKK